MDLEEMDVEELARQVIDAAVGPHRPVVCVAPLAGGFSGRVFRVDVADPAEILVLRRLPSGPVAAQVEAAVSRRLAGVVPVPEVLLAAAEPEPVTLARWADGQRLEDVLPGADATTTRALGHTVGRALAAIGSVRFAEGGFFTGGDLAVAAHTGSAPEQLVGYVTGRLGSPVPALPAPLRVAYLDLIRRDADVLADLDGAPALVHSDYNPKNLLVSREADGWRVGAVLDWEFTFAGSPLTDVANMLRHPEMLPAEYAGAFVAGFRDGGGSLPRGWQKRARVLDVFALVDFLAADPPRGLWGAARAIAERCVARGWI